MNLAPLPSRRLLANFLKVFFKLLYNQFSWSYDLVANAVSIGKWKTWVLAVLPDLMGPNVLELGHGPGHLLVAMTEAGLYAIGLDASLKMSRIAWARLRRKNRFGLLVNGYAQSLPFSDAYFNNIVTTFPSDFILHPASLSEAYRVLTPGGTMIVLPIAWITGTSWLDRLAAALFRITGEAPDWDDRFSQPFIQAGFRVEIVFRLLQTSRLLILHAYKVE